MKRKRILLSIIAILVICAGMYGYRQYTRKVKDLSHVKADVRMNAMGLVSAFESNEAMANEQFLDKVIAVNGIVKSVDQNEQGHYSVVLGEEGIMSSVRCSMDSIHQDAVADLAAGSFVTMKGACTGFNPDELLGSDVILNRCVVEQ